MFAKVWIGTKPVWRCVVVMRAGHLGILMKSLPIWFLWIRLILWWKNWPLKFSPPSRSCCDGVTTPGLFLRCPEISI